MATELLLAPVGAGKTEQALERIVEQSEAKPFARIWVLLATERQINEFRNRLIQYTAEKPVFFNVEFFTFYDLYRRILEASGQPTRQLGEAARLRLLRVLFQRMTDSGDLRVYSRIASKSGFIRIVADFIYELKQAIIEPAYFSDITDSLFGVRQKDNELAKIYNAYQERLREHDIVDREGQGWLALARLEADPALHRDVDLVVVDGYDQFTPLQAQIVTLMARRVGDMLVTLTTVPGREATVGRRFQAAQRSLELAYRFYEMPLTVNAISGQIEQRHNDLQHLADNIFRLDAVPVESSDAVKFIPAPDVVTETAAVLREVKRLLLTPEANTEADDIIIVLRDYERYQAHIQTTGRAYGLPMALHMGQALSKIPPIRELMQLITLHDMHINLTDYLRRPVMDALGSPYFQIKGITTHEVELLDRISREFAVVGGREMWLEAVDAASKERIADEDDEMRSRPALISEKMRDHLTDSLNAFFDATTPPPRATMKAYITWLENLIGHDPLIDPDDADEGRSPGVLNMIASIRKKAPAYIINRDLAAMSEFKKVLKTLLSAQLLLQTLEQTGDELTWAEFLADLRSSVERASIESAPEREGRILVTTATDARGLPHKHVFIPGLSEGIFPLRQPEDPLYLDNERKQLAQNGLAISTAAERAADDGLFYEIISLALDTLTLSRPTARDGAPHVESHLWRAAAAVFTNAEEHIHQNEIRVGKVVSPAQAATPDELITAVADGFTHPDPSPEIIGSYNWLLENATPIIENVLTGHTVEAERISVAEHSRYTGLIRDPALLTELQRALGPDHRWSASQLNDYGICPYRFFVARVLHLSAIEDPQMGMDARQLGSLNHSILEKTYRNLAERKITIEARNLDEALKILDEVAAEVMENAPERFGFRESPVWEQEKAVLLRRLRSLVQFDFLKLPGQLEKNGFGTHPRLPYQMETPFGIGGHGALIDVGDDVPPVYVAGYIDRIDRMGDDAVVLDYKTGRTAIHLDELKTGRNFQIMLYILATQGILQAKQGNEPDAPTDVRGGYFLHIREPKTSGDLNINEFEHQTLIENARTTIASYIKRAQSGDFAVKPSKLTEKRRCVFYCEFYKLCRIAITDVEKPIP